MTDKEARRHVARSAWLLRADHDQPFLRGQASAYAIVAGDKTYLQWGRISDKLWARRAAAKAVPA